MKITLDVKYQATREADMSKNIGWRQWMHHCNLDDSPMNFQKRQNHVERQVSSQQGKWTW